MILLFACTADPVDSKTEDTDTTPVDSDPGTDSGTDSGTTAVLLSGLAVTVHPEIGSLLVATWDQETPGDVWLEFGLEGEEPHRSPLTAREAGAQEQVLIGVPYDSDVNVSIFAGSDTTAVETVAARTDPLPETVPVPELVTLEEGQFDEPWILIGMSSGGEGWAAEGFWKMVLDRKGRVVWAHETPNGYRTFYMQPSHDGTHIVWDEDTFWTDFDLGAGSVVHRMTLDGATIETIPTPGLHHAFLDLGDGVIAWGGHDDPREVLRERAADGTVTEIWDCTQWWNSHGATRDCDGNALYFDAASDTYLYSSDNMATVAFIQRSTGDVLRTVGQLEGSMPFADGTGTLWKQHSPTFTPEGNLLLSQWQDESNHEVIAREFEIDETEGVVREVWRCGDGTGTTGDFGGEAHRLPNGNTLLNYGEGGVLREYTTDCTEVWQIAWPFANLLGRAVFLDDLYDYMP